MISIKPHHMAVLTSIFQTYAPAMHVWAYGSRINGQGHDASDLDLVVRNEPATEVPLANMAKLRGALDDSSLPFLVDLHDWALLPAEMRRQILKAYVVLCAPGNGSLPPSPGGNQNHGNTSRVSK